MFKRKILIIIVLGMMLSIQACATRMTRFEYIQAFKESGKRDSEISWVTVDKVYDKDGTGLTDLLQVSFYEQGASISGNRHSYVALPAGEHNYLIRYFHDWKAGTSSTEWMNVKESFMGGKCYEIYADVVKYDALAKNNPYDPGSGSCTFKVREVDCVKVLWGGDKYYQTVDLYKMDIPRKNPVIERKRSLNLFSDEALAPYREEFRNGEVVRVTLPFDFINQLYRDLENQE